MINNQYVIVRLQGGMANQMYCYATAKAIAIKLEKKLLIDERPIRGEGPKRKYELSNFIIQEQHVYGLKKWCTRWVASVRLGYIFKILCPFAWNYKMIRDKETGFMPEVFNHHRGTIVLQGYWQSYKYFDFIKNTLKQEFTFKSEPDKINSQLINEIKTLNSVGIHIRRGDYVSTETFNAIFGTCTMDYYHRSIQTIKKLINNPFFFIFTDDPDWVSKNFNEDVPFKIVNNNLGKNDWADLRLLMNCKHYIIANSSFSWWGAYLSNNEKKIVIAPKKWFNVDFVPTEDRIPLNWILL